MLKYMRMTNCGKRGAVMITKAKWISTEKGCGKSAVKFERIFSITESVSRATLFISSIGTYAAYINGLRIGRFIFAPGLTLYDKRIQYQTYDVTELLKKENLLCVEVGTGWALSSYLWGDGKYFGFDKPCLIATLFIEYESGEKESISTSDGWDVYTSQVMYSDLYHGETVDMTAEKKHLGKAACVDVNTNLMEQTGEIITEQERLSPLALITTPKDEKVLDFGQNIAGYVEIKIKGRYGEKIVLHHAEVLDKDGNFYNENYRSSRSEAVYILDGKENVFKPKHAFYGFRYVRISEFTCGEINPDDFTAVVVSSDMARTSEFVSGNEKINRLYDNCIRSQKGNYIDIPTDCPQRDERIGWTGDAQVFCRTAAINFDVEKFFKKWLGDLRLDQGKNGEIYGFCLPVPGRYGSVGAAWSDSATIIPWQLYRAYGNIEILKDNYPMMKKWVGYVRGFGEEEFLWLGHSQWGDWLAMDAGENTLVGATSKDLIASAFYANSVDIVVKSGKILGEDVSEYEELYKNVRAAFRSYFMENGMPKEEIPPKNPDDITHRGMTQTAISLILNFNLCEDCERECLAKKLASLIKDNRGLMATGFVGTPYLLHALSDNGFSDVAYDLLFEERSPSWLYSVNKGATTIWEHWDGIKEDGSFWSKNMNSFNHYAYGAVFDWIFANSVGITPHSPGYKSIKLAPVPDKRLGFVNSRIKTRAGDISVKWSYEGDVVIYEFDIPKGVKANLCLPSGCSQILEGGRYIFSE